MEREQLLPVTSDKVTAFRYISLVVVLLSLADIGVISRSLCHCAPLLNETNPAFPSPLGTSGQFSQPGAKLSSRRAHHHTRKETPDSDKTNSGDPIDLPQRDGLGSLGGGGGGRMLGDNTGQDGEGFAGSLWSSLGNYMGLGTSRSTRIRHGGKKVKMACDPTPVSALQNMLGPAFNARYMAVDKPMYSTGDIGASFRAADDPLAGGDGITSTVPPFTVQKTYRQDLPHEVNYLEALISLLKQYSGSSTKASFHQSQAGSLRSRSEPVVKRDLRREGRTLETFPVHPILDHVISKRQLKKPSLGSTEHRETWQCAQEIVWKDLGEDHFPRFLRTVTCLQGPCFFNTYQCREKSFTVKVLRRVSDECVPVYSAPGAEGGGGDEPVLLRYEQEWIFEERALPFCCECARRLSRR